MIEYAVTLNGDERLRVRIRILDQVARRVADLVALFLREHLQGRRSEEHTSELQSLMRISYAVFCLKKKNRLEVMTLKAAVGDIEISAHEQKNKSTIYSTYRCQTHT